MLRQWIRSASRSAAQGMFLRPHIGKLHAVAATAAASVVAGGFLLDSSVAQCDTTAVDKTSLVGKVALVTGGTGSIGLAVAKSLAAQGCRIAVVDLNEDKCKEVAAHLPSRSIGVAIDVSSESAVAAGVARIAQDGP